jgi:hypothetical protein
MSRLVGMRMRLMRLATLLEEEGLYVSGVRLIVGRLHRHR